jgi:hypothetical protein
VTTRSDDELAVPHFKERLWRELEELHGATATTGTTATASAAGSVAPARSARRPRLLAAAAVVAVGGAVAGVVLVAGRDAPTTITAPAGQSTTTAGVTTTRGERPLGIVLTETRYAGGNIGRSWKDEQTGLWRELAIGPDGNPRSDSGWTTRRQVGDEVVITVRNVDHCFREYQDEELRLPLEAVREAMPENRRVGAIPEAMFDDGELVADGTEVVDGRELLRYLDDENDGVVWLDPETRELVRQRYATRTDDEQTTTYEFLARTPENLAVLAPEVPPGYTTPFTDRTDEEWAAAGCS